MGRSERSEAGAARMASAEVAAGVVAAPRPSASVILVRESPTGLETFMVRRHARSPVLPSAYVFPGGTVRPDDLDLQVDAEESQRLARALSERSDSPVQAEPAVAYYVSALRELFEEAGVLLGRAADGRLLTVDATDTLLQERLAATRLALQARDLSLATVLAEWRCQPAFDLLVPFSHWVTPALLVARFDTRFFVAEMPPGQAALHDTIELSDGIWLPPQRVLDDEYNVVYATAQHLRRLAPFHTVRELLEFAGNKRIQRLSPEVTEGGSGLKVFIRPELVDAW
jgi:8-oxo-dGTP pyrophosphatase MutT (NUDIX family)